MSGQHLDKPRADSGRANQHAEGNRCFDIKAARLEERNKLRTHHREYSGADGEDSRQHAKKKPLLVMQSRWSRITWYGAPAPNPLWRGRIAI